MTINLPCTYMCNSTFGSIIYSYILSKMFYNFIIEFLIIKIMSYNNNNYYY